MSDLAKKIEALLFYKNEPVSQKKLAEALGVEMADLSGAIEDLRSQNTSRGIVLLVKDDELALGTNPEFGELIEKIQKEELNKELSKASLETLSIVLYKNGATRSEIDYIRGVNSSFILRALVLRGLVEKISDTQDSRRLIYKPTFDLLSFLGVRMVEELPNYGEMLNKIQEGVADLANAEKVS